MEFNQITFEECVNAIMDTSEGNEVPYIKEQKDMLKNPNDLEKTLEFKVSFRNYEFKYLQKNETIIISNKTFVQNIEPLKFSIHNVVEVSEPPFLMVTKENFGKGKHLKLFNALLEYTSIYNKMKSLENNLPPKDIKTPKTKV